MRIRPIPKGWTSWCGVRCTVNIAATTSMLEASYPGAPGSDAYSEAAAILDLEGKLTYDELSARVSSPDGYLSLGCVLDTGIGRAYWERRDKDTCLRWAIADKN